LFLFFVFTPKVLADGVSVSWVNVPSNGSLNTQFDVRVKVTATTAGTYYVRADNGSDCKIDMLYNESWSNSCNVGVDSMQPMKIDSSGGSTEEILRLRVRNTGSTGTYTLYTYVYDSGKNLLNTSTAASITINATTPTPTATQTPTPTPTSAITATPTPTKILTPTPTEVPMIEPTSVIEPTIAPIVSTNQGTTEASTNETKKSGLSLPVILITLGLLMFAGPVVVPKIMAKIKSGKRKGPPTIIPPKQPPETPPEQRQPTFVREVAPDGEDVSNF